MIISVLLFLVGFIFLIKGGDWFVDGSIGIAKRFNISDLLIGATIVSIGTTLPEVMVSASAALTGHGEIAYGNAIGSIICNTALIAATTLVFSPGPVKTKALKTPVLFFFGTAILYALVAYFYGYFSRTIGVILLLIFLNYILITIRQMRDKSLEKNNEVEELSNPVEQSLLKEIILILLGATLIALGANLLVDNGTVIAQSLGVPESVIALTFVALGTSLPELVTAITSLIKGHGALSLGNIIGANLFNLVLVSGVSITLSPFSIPQNSTIFGYNASLLLDFPIMFLVMIILVVPALITGKLTRIQGLILWAIYLTYCIVEFVM